MGSSIIIPFTVIDDKLSKSSASNAVLVSQSEATKSQLSSLEIAHTETKKRLESERVIHRQERVIHRQALDEAEAKAHETEGTKRKLEARALEIEGVLEVVRSKLNGLHEVTKE